MTRIASIFRRTVLAAIAWAAVTTLMACGGDEPQKERARERPSPAIVQPQPVNSRAAIADVVRSYFNALAAGDGKRACALMASSAQVEVVALGSDPDATCEEAVKGAFAAVEAESRRELLNPLVSDIAIHGDTARAKALEGRREIRLQLNDGKWQILSVEITRP